jgi:drug/metabolite transporter (DMT)-like permease
MKKGIHYALTAALISGCSVYVNSLFVSSGSSPVSFVTARNLLAAFCLSVLILPRIYRRFFSLTAREWVHLGVIGAIGGGIPFAFFFSGLSEIGAVAGNTLNKTQFLWVGLLAAIILGETVLLRRWQSYLLAATAICLTWPGLVLSRPAYFVLTATMLWSLEYVISKKLLAGAIGPDLLVFSRVVFGLPFLFGAAFYSGTGWGEVAPLMMTGQVIVSSLFFITFMHVWYRALKYAAASIVALVMAASPVVTVLLEAYLLDKPVSAVQAVQSLFLIAAIFLLVNRVRSTTYGFKQ